MCTAQGLCSRKYKHPLSTKANLYGFGRNIHYIDLFCAVRRLLMLSVLRLDAEKENIHSYLGQHVALVSTNVPIFTVEEHACRYPDGQIPGEK